MSNSCFCPHTCSSWTEVNEIQLKFSAACRSRPCVSRLRLYQPHLCLQLRYLVLSCPHEQLTPRSETQAHQPRPDRQAGHFTSSTQRPCHPRLIFDKPEQTHHPKPSRCRGPALRKMQVPIIPSRANIDTNIILQVGRATTQVMMKTGQVVRHQ